MSSPFLDTNVFVYLVTGDPRSEIAAAIVAKPYRISVQTLNEFALAGRRKLRLDWLEINLILEEIKTGSEEIFPQTLASHQRALALAQRYGVRIYDANQLAVALGAGAELFISEDMHDGLVIENRLIIRNPFA